MIIHNLYSMFGPKQAEEVKTQEEEDKKQALKILMSLFIMHTSHSLLTYHSN